MSNSEYRVSLSDTSNIEDLWIKFSAQISKEFGIKTAPSQMSMLEPVSWESIFAAYSDVINHPLCVMVFNAPFSLIGAISFACMKEALANYNLCEPCRTDLALEFARQYLLSQDAERWRGMWSQAVPSIDVPPNLVYNPSRYFSFLYSLTGKRGLQQIIQELTSFYRGNIELTFTKYVWYLHQRFRYFSTGLDRTELKVIKACLDNPEARTHQVARSLGMSPQWVSTRITSIKSRGILRQFDWLPFSRINIRMFYVFLTGLGELADPLLLVRDSPFLYLFQSLITGHADALVIFCVPDNQMSIHALTLFDHLATKWNVDVEFFEVARSGRSYNLQSYDPFRQQWSIHWYSLLHNIQSTSSVDTMLLDMITRPRTKPQIRLTKLDLKILNAVQSRITGVAQIRQAVKGSQNSVANRLRLLKQHGLIMRFSELHNVGLVERVVVQAKNTKAISQLAKLSSQLPSATISISSDDTLIVVVDLPAGGSTHLLQIIDSLNDDIFTAFLGEPLYGSWKIPLHLWNIKLQMWNAPTMQIRKWLDCIY